MTDFLINIYLWLLAGHIIFVIFWMAALYYLPRLFAYHADVPRGAARAGMLAKMERRLLNIIATPSMCGAWGFGLLLLFVPELIDWGLWWIWVKLALVLSLTFFHFACMGWRRGFLTDARPRSPRFYRVVNEIAPVVTIFIVILVVLKPF